VLFCYNIGVVECLHATLDCELEGDCHLLDVLNANLMVAWRECREMVLKVRLASLLFQSLSFGVSESKSKFFGIRSDVD
jgi:hypothetical protein